MTKTTKTSQITESETLEELAKEIKSEEQLTEQPEPIKPVETAQAESVPEPSQLESTKPGESEPTEEVSE